LTQTGGTLIAESFESFTMQDWCAMFILSSETIRSPTVISVLQKTQVNGIPSSPWLQILLFGFQLFDPILDERQEIPDRPDAHPVDHHLNSQLNSQV
jgi:hypothetical protein